MLLDLSRALFHPYSYVDHFLVKIGKPGEYPPAAGNVCPGPGGEKRLDIGTVGNKTSICTDTFVGTFQLLPS